MEKKWTHLLIARKQFLTADMPASEQWELAGCEGVDDDRRSSHAAANKPPVARIDVNRREKNSEKGLLSV